jgi:hypothetical protein
LEAKKAEKKALYEQRNNELNQKLNNDI